MFRIKMLEFYSWVSGILVVGVLPFALIIIANTAQNISYEGKTLNIGKPLDFYSPSQFLFCCFVAVVIKLFLNFLPVRDRTKLLIALISASMSITLLVLNSAKPFVVGLFFSTSSGIWGLTSYVFFSILIMVTIQSAIRSRYYLLSVYLLLFSILIHHIGGILILLNFTQLSYFLFLSELLAFPVGVVLFVANLLELIHWEFFLNGEFE